MRSSGGRMSSIAIAAGCAALIVAACALAAPARAGSVGAVADAYALYGRGDYAAAAGPLMRLAEAGEPRAQALLGFLYENGHGVPQDFAVAAMWYTCAAEQGEPAAQYLLGLLYNNGRGVPMDVVLAQKWLILAAARADRREREIYLRMRDAVATKLSYAQLSLAQQLALQWVPTPRLPLR